MSKASRWKLDHRLASMKANSAPIYWQKANLRLALSCTVDCSRSYTPVFSAILLTSFNMAYLACTQTHCLLA